MNNLKSKILYSFIFILCLAMPFSVSASLNVSMNGSSSPAALFDQDNVLPGDSFVRYIEVNNSDDNDYLIGTKAASSTNIDGLGDKMILTISDNLGHEYFRDSLTVFFALDDSSGVMFENIEAYEENRLFKYEVYFEEETTNQYQDGGVSFNIVVGYEVVSGIGETSAGSIDGGAVVNGVKLSEAEFLDNSNYTNSRKVFGKNSVWKVFDSSFSMVLPGLSIEQDIFAENFSVIELTLLLVFVLTFFGVSYLLKKRRTSL